MVGSASPKYLVPMTLYISLLVIFPAKTEPSDADRAAVDPVIAIACLIHPDMLVSTHLSPDPSVPTPAADKYHKK